MGLLGKIAKGTVNVAVGIMNQAINNGASAKYDAGLISREERQATRDYTKNVETKVEKATKKWD